jgi:hypothetical protein
MGALVSCTAGERKDVLNRILPLIRTWENEDKLKIANKQPTSKKDPQIHQGKTAWKTIVKMTIQYGHTNNMQRHAQATKNNTALPT